MKKKVKMIIAAVCAVVVAIVAVYSVVKPLAVETVTLEAQTVSLTFTETGSYEYSRVYAVYPFVSGEILEVLVNEGERVQAGDVIAVVSAVDYEYQILQLNSTIAGYNGQINNLLLQEQQEKTNLRATLQGLEGQLVTLEAEMEMNRRAGDSLETQIDIQERIVSINRNSVQHARDYLREMRDYGEDYEVIQARQALTTAQNALAQNQLLLEQLREGNVPDDVYEGQRKALEGQMSAVNQQLGQSYTGGMVQYYNAQITAAQHSIDQMEEMTGKATILSPVSGVIQELPARDQNLLSQQMAAASIGDAPYVEVFVPVREIDGIAVGDTVELILDKRLGSQLMDGTIFDIEEEAQVKISALGVEERKVRVLIRPAENDLQIGYDMDVRFSPYTFTDVLVVPKTAVFQTEGTDYVWIVEGGSAQRRQVEKGVETRDGYVIEGGLLEGDVVVADADNSGLSPGKRISD